MAAIGVRAGLPSAHSMKALCKGSVATRSRVQRPEAAWAYPWRRPKPGARAPPLAPAGMIRRRIPVVEPNRGGDECSRRRFDTGRPEMIQFTFTFTFICHRVDTINLLTRRILYSLRHGGEPGHTIHISIFWTRARPSRTEPRLRNSPGNSCIGNASSPPARAPSSTTSTPRSSRCASII